MKIETSKAPKAIGPYSQARLFGDLLFISGQIPLDPATGTMPDGVEAQMRQVLANLAAIAEAAGTDLSRTVKTTVLLTDLGTFQAVNAIYAEAFSDPYPARATFEVSALPLGAQVEVEAVVALR